VLYIGEVTILGKRDSKLGGHFIGKDETVWKKWIILEKGYHMAEESLY